MLRDATPEMIIHLETSLDKLVGPTLHWHTVFNNWEQGRVAGLMSRDCTASLLHALMVEKQVRTSEQAPQEPTGHRMPYLLDTRPGRSIFSSQLTASDNSIGEALKAPSIIVNKDGSSVRVQRVSPQRQPVPSIRCNTAPTQPSRKRFENGGSRNQVRNSSSHSVRSPHRVCMPRGAAAQQRAQWELQQRTQQQKYGWPMPIHQPSAPNSQNSVLFHQGDEWEGSRTQRISNKQKLREIRSHTEQRHKVRNSKVLRHKPKVHTQTTPRMPPAHSFRNSPRYISSMDLQPPLKALSKEWYHHVRNNAIDKYDGKQPTARIARQLMYQSQSAR